MKNLLVLLAIALSLTSCTDLLLTAYGVKAPQIESYTSLSYYANQKGLNMAGLDIKSYFKKGISSRANTLRNECWSNMLVCKVD